jgi:plasmid stabilization system protein ParE
MLIPAKSFDYLAREAGQMIADVYGRRFQTTLERITDMPESGALRQSLGPVVVVYPYILIYDYAKTNDTVTLLRILHGRRNIAGDDLKR